MRIKKTKSAVLVSIMHGGGSFRVSRRPAKTTAKRFRSIFSDSSGIHCIIFATDTVAQELETDHVWSVGPCQHG